MRLGTYYRFLVMRKLSLLLSGNDVLDIGGFDGFVLSKINSKNKTLIDINADERYPNIRYIKDDFLSHEFNGQKYDVIYAMDVLEHIQEYPPFLQKIIQLLSSEGIAIISFPSRDISVFPYVAQSFIDKRWGHVYRRGFSADELVNVVNANNKLQLNVIQWDCPLFRFLYLLFSLSWRMSPVVTQKFLEWSITVDSKFPKQNNGYLYVIIKNVSK